jgi:RNase H-like domain found in reverse transcriptase
MLHSQFSRLSRPLNNLTQKNTPWIWGTIEQQAFKTLKTCFTTAPVLIQPDPLAPFRLECDASKMVCGAVLSQKGEDLLWHPIAYMSKSFIEAERNYDIYDRELLAIIRALEEWRHYLEGSPHPIEILSDHKNLEVFKEARKLSRRQARWSLYLSLSTSRSLMSQVPKWGNPMPYHNDPITTLVIRITKIVSSSPTPYLPAPQLQSFSKIEICNNKSRIARPSMPKSTTCSVSSKPRTPPLNFAITTVYGKSLTDSSSTTKKYTSPMTPTSDETLPPSVMTRL